MGHVHIGNSILRWTYREHYNKWHGCERCDIASHRNKAVLVRGHLPASVLFIGEGPGKAEDALGTPFIGPAGRLLDKWIDYSGTYTYAITNLVACRPTNCVGGANRQPSEDEVRHCHERLIEVFYMAMPKLVIAVGRVAENNLLELTREILPLKITMVAILHPAYVLRAGDSVDSVERERLRKSIEEYL